jgi:hypothetical protein
MTIYVDDDAPADFSTIQAAIDDANDGDTVVIQPGTYTGPGNRDVNFQGKAITVQSVDPNDPKTVATTVIDCQGTESDPHGGFLFFTYRDMPDSALAGLTVINGYRGIGGGILCSGYASPTIRNCRLTGNRAMRGGGIYVGTGTPIIRNCVITNNSASGRVYGEGGGIYCGSMTSATISGCTIAGNSASGSGASPGAGGGIYLSVYSAMVRHCTIVGNTAEVGGGIYCAELDEVAIADCIVRSNRASRGPQISATPSVSYSNIEGHWQGLGNINADPLFMDPGSGDYHLSIGSPCIDAGDPQYIPYPGQADLDNEPRVMGLRVDMGADEYTSSPTAVLNVYPKQLVFHADVNGANPESQVLHIENAGFAPLTWAITKDCPWLGASEPADGTQGLGIAVDVGGLSPGRYDYLVTITADDVPNSPQAVAVSLYVRAGRYLRVPQPYGTIQSAIEAAHDGDTIIVEAGTYTGLGNRDIDFLGKAITVQSTDPNDPGVVAATIIDCGGRETEPHRGFLFRNGEGANSVLMGLAITGGLARQGAGVCIENSSPTILRCNITGNVCYYASNRKDGAGIYIRDGSPYIGQCLIANNRCEGTSSNGGGVFCYNASPVIRDCYITSNEVRDRGAGVHGEYASNLTLSSCTITNNRATFRAGGGICLRWSNGVLNHCLIAENQSGSGGGMYLERSEISVQNCTVVGNTDGVYFSLGRLSLQDTILWANGARGGSGSQIAVYSWNGINDAPWNFFQLTGIVDISYCDIEGGSSKIYISGDQRCLQFNWSEGNIDTDPLFANPRYSDPNGTPSRGVRSLGEPLVGARWDYHLKSQAGRWDPVGKSWVIDDVTSPCIDAGDPNRPVGDEPEPNGGRINMGAYGGTAEASKSYSGG